MTTLVVGWDGYIDELGWRVSVAKSDDWNVDVGSLLDGLSIGTRIGDDDETGLLERTGDVVGEVTRGETTSNGDSSGVSSELQDSTLTVRAGRDDTDIGWVVDSCDDTGREDDLLPGKTDSLVFFLKLNTITNILTLQNCGLARGIWYASPKLESPKMSSSSPEFSVPGLANVDNIDSIRASLPEVWLHVNLQVLGSKVALSAQEHLNILRGSIEN